MEAKRQTRTYTAEFKLEAVRLSQQPGSTVAGVARNLGVPLSVLQGWRRQQREQGRWPKRPASGSSSESSRSPARSGTS
jgi:transposase-like protein